MYLDQLLCKFVSYLFLNIPSKTTSTHNKVNYFTVVRKCVVGDDGKFYNNRKVKTVQSFKFTGKERNSAIKKANELLIEYNTKDLRKNF